MRSPVYLSYVFIHSVLALEVYYLDLQSNKKQKTKRRQEKTKQDQYDTAAYVFTFV